MSANKSIDNIIDQIKNKNQEAGRRLTLEELMSLEGPERIDRVETNNLIEQFLLVHATDYQPEDDKIKTVVEKNIRSQMNHFGIDIEIPLVRDTTHFTVNGRVTSHGEGNWDKRKYAVLTPLKDFLVDNGENLR